MDMSFLVIDFIIFTVAAILGFIWGAMWVDSEFERDSYYLAAEVENLNDLLDAKIDAYHDLYREKDAVIASLTADNEKLWTALKRAMDTK